MDRRKFINTTTCLTAASLLPLNFDQVRNNKKYKLGYQLYSIRDYMADAPVDTLKKLKAMGYEDFEVYGYDSEKNIIYGMTPSEFQNIVADLGLSISSGHYNFSPLLNEKTDVISAYVDKCIYAAKSMKSAYITWPFLAPEQRNIESFKKLAEVLNIIGEQVKASGLGFAYHNHGYELQEREGTSGYDIIISETEAELVKLQMDMYWAMYEGVKTPKKLVSEQPGRYVMWHIKDMDVVTRDYTELGNGSINYQNVLPDAGQSGLEYLFIEQGGNFSTNSLLSAETSAEFYKSDLESIINGSRRR